ncbi:ABC transporter substrate-binding protein [Nocardiopsis algeriensis]|uniref:Peptide/nickel transport system substrate-binding protein n=1 Tax=Nocardiopsis algeriensis TaxID=1478215 RepID=A0A841ISF9_9ACTN|nr:ABC transporter substrate-binding protein [Nocardiopsis algeriensis]MBB6119545.1 peptide/nickel transport system substrate-binding protein [Nocardiopsis algeriensis]
MIGRPIHSHGSAPSPGRPRRRRTALPGLAVLTATTLLLTACGMPGSSEGTGEQASHITVGTSVTEDAINPLNKQYATFQFNAFDALVRQMRGDEEPQPRLATDWEQVSDTLWRFTLREGATFHNGEPVTAEDVVFSFNEILEEQFANAAYISTVASVREGEGGTVEIETKEPDPLLLSHIGQIFIVPKAHWEEVGGADGFSADPVGSGPYEITSFDPSTGVEYQAFDGFWGQEPATEKVTVRYIADTGALSAALESGEIDIAHELASDAIETLSGRDDIQLHNEFSGLQNMFQLNTVQEPFDDVRVRRAAVAAIDAPSMIDALTFGAGIIEDGQVSAEGVFGHSPEITRPEFDLDHARELLEEADAVGAEITLSGQSRDRTLLESIGSQLDAAGFETTIEANEIGVWVEQFRNGTDADIFYRGSSYSGVFDAGRPYSFISSGERPFVEDEEWTRLYEAQRTEMDPEKREQLLIEASEYVRDQAYVLYTFGRPSVSASLAGVEGVDYGDGLVLLLDEAVKTG